MWIKCVGDDGLCTGYGLQVPVYTEAPVSGAPPPGGRDEAFGHRIPAASCHRDWADGAVVVEHRGLCGGCHGLPRGPPSEAGSLPF